jgi:hypothetical protein
LRSETEAAELKLASTAELPIRDEPEALPANSATPEQQKDDESRG